MKAIYPYLFFKGHQLKDWFASKWVMVKAINRKEIIITLTVGLTILLFMYTAVSKLFNYKIFVFQIQLAPLPLMATVAPYLGWIVPVVELLLVILLFLNRTRFWGMICSLLLMLSFEFYIGWMKVVAMQTGIDLPCTCGGIISNMGWTTHLLFNAVFIFLLGLSIYYERAKRKLKAI